MIDGVLYLLIFILDFLSCFCATTLECACRDAALRRCATNDGYFTKIPLKCGESRSKNIGIDLEMNENQQGMKLNSITLTGHV